MYFVVEKVIVCFASLQHMTLEEMASWNKKKILRNLLKNVWDNKVSKCPGMESQMVQIQETKLASRSTITLSRSQEISIMLNKINSRSTNFLSRSRL